MAEWLGELMTNWPSWLIGFVALIILIGGAVVMFYWDLAAWGNGSWSLRRRKKNGKK